MDEFLDQAREKAEAQTEEILKLIPTLGLDQIRGLRDSVHQQIEDYSVLLRKLESVGPQDINFELMSQGIDFATEGAMVLSREMFDRMWMSSHRDSLRQKIVSVMAMSIEGFEKIRQEVDSKLREKDRK